MNPPSRLSLARLPTPLEPMTNMAERLGVNLWVKRDDLTGMELSGNKIRKLEFLLAEGRAQGADVVISCGGEQSNHCRATALAARRLGMDAHVLLRTRDPASPPAPEGNFLLLGMVGARIEWVSADAYQQRDERMAAVAEDLRRKGRTPYVIPEGGSNALGAWGYIEAARELAGDMRAAQIEDATVVYAVGSGGTGAGLLLGARLHCPRLRVVGFNVCNDRDHFVDAIGTIAEQANERYQLGLQPKRSDIEIVDGYVGKGYAQSSAPELELIREVARNDALLLDPVYTGKAFFGLTHELARDPHAFGKTVIFLHTGGLFGLFPKADELAPLL